MTAQTVSFASSLRSVHSGLLRSLQWQAKFAVSTTFGGEYRSLFRGRGIEFDQVVQYQWGDDPRDIDWNVTARLGTPYRKRFVEERDLSLVFVFEDTLALQFGSTGRSRRQTLIETISLLALIGGLNRCRVGLFYRSPKNSWFIAPRPGRAGSLRSVTRLLAEPPPPIDGPSVVKLPWEIMRSLVSRGSVLVWAGAFSPATPPAVWADLQSRYRLVGVRADDPWDAALPKDAKFLAYDPVTSWLTELDGASAASQAAHQRWRNARESYLAGLMPREEDRLLIATTIEPLTAIVAWFHRQHRAASGDAVGCQA